MVPALALLSVVLLALVLLPVAVRIQVRSRGGLVLLRLSAGAWLGLCGLCAHWQDRRWRLHLVLGGWPVRWPAWQLTGGGAPPEPAPVRSAACKDKEEAAGRRRRLRTEFLLLLWRPLLKLLHGMVRSVGFRSGTIQGVIGCGDPACTGWIYAAQQSLGHVPLGRLHVEVVPSFTRVGFHGRVDVLLHLRPHQLLWALLRTGFEVGIRWLKSQRRRH